MVPRGSNCLRWYVFSSFPLQDIIPDFDLAKLRQELDQNWHIYQTCKRVWAMKPFDAPQAVPEPTVETVASESPSPAQPSKKKQKTESEDDTKEA